MGKIGMELLAPAGGMEQLRAAVAFGADAVYLAAERFGMRARAANFRMDEIPAAVAFAHDHGVKVHVTCNILMHPDDIDGLPPFFRALDAAGVDAFIIGDVGAFAVAGEVAPRVERHVSTQASVANATAARVWHSLGASRVVCAARCRWPTSPACARTRRRSGNRGLRPRRHVHGRLGPLPHQQLPHRPLRQQGPLHPAVPLELPARRRLACGDAAG